MPCLSSLRAFMTSSSFMACDSIIKGWKRKSDNLSERLEISSCLIIVNIQYIDNRSNQCPNRRLSLVEQLSNLK
jgi:hypothetical protein